MAAVAAMLRLHAAASVQGTALRARAGTVGDGSIGVCPGGHGGPKARGYLAVRMAQPGSMVPAPQRRCLLGDQLLGLGDEILGAHWLLHEALGRDLPSLEAPLEGQLGALLHARDEHDGGGG